MMPGTSQPVKATEESPPEPTELEGAVLGLVAREGPISAHAVRRTFQASPTDHFSGSAGSIYPLVRRLTAAGLIEPERGARGQKGGAAYVTTERGLDALRRWTTPDDPAWMSSVTFDPLRTRVLTLGWLSPEERERFLLSAEAGLEAREREQAADLRDADADPWVLAACEGALAVTRARLRWIRSLRRAAPEPRAGPE